MLSALVIVHELGHFLVAKKFGIRVDEFGLGLPPRAKKLFTWKETPFTLNWLPFGGFVKIFGENPADGETKTNSSKESFVSKHRGIQAAVLVAGVVGNFLFAWVLITLGFMVGLPVPAGLSLPMNDPRTVITMVLPGSPADLADLEVGDTILSVSRESLYSQLTPEAISMFIVTSDGPLTFEIEREEALLTKVVTPEQGIVVDKPAVGISMDLIGQVKLPPHSALWYGFKTTSVLTYRTAEATVAFIFQALGGRADLSAVTGPVGIVGMVGDARGLGFGYLLTFAALISINLAVINLLPFPALDGGRLLFVAIEGVTRRSIPARVFNALNSVGFALLIFLMLYITFQDVRNIF
jgi:regulator of sigma E protease